MEKVKWVSVFESTEYEEAFLILQALLSYDLNAVLLNKTDTNYPWIQPKSEVKVMDVQKDQALAIIEELKSL